MANHRHHAGIHQLAGNFFPRVGTGPVVHGDHFQLDQLAFHTETFLVELGNGQIDAIEQILAQCRQIATQWLRDANLDGGWRTVAALQQKAGANNGQGDGVQRKAAGGV